MNDKPDHFLDELFARARAQRPDTSRAEFAFETRLLARLHTERDEASIWAMVAWRLAPIFAACAIALAVWNAQVVSATDEATALANLDQPESAELWSNLN